MNRYAIRRNNRNKIVGILNYDEKEKKYTIEIPENVTPKEAPFMISLFLKKGIRTMNSDWSMRWVQSRIIPSSRQNIGEILRVNGVSANETLYVGDSGVDMQTAAAATVTSVGVTWGFRTCEELVENGACYIVDSPAEILELSGRL